MFLKKLMYYEISLNFWKVLIVLIDVYNIIKQLKVRVSTSFQS